MLIIKKIISRFYRSYNFFGRWSSKNYIKYLHFNGVKVGKRVRFRYPESTKIDLTRPSLIEIGDDVDINANFTIMIHDFGTFVFRNLFGDFVPSSGRVKIGSNIYFGRDVTVLKGVEIGDNCIIGLGSVVSKSIPSNSVAVGVPARVICSIEDYYQKRKKNCIDEAIDYGVSIIRNKHRQPVITDFPEEWTLFLTAEEWKNHPEIHPAIRFRLKDKFYSYMSSHKPVFNGFDDFIKSINERAEK